MPNVKFIKEKKTIEVPEGANLRKEAMKHGVVLYPGVHQYANCWGNGLCWSCRVDVVKGEENVTKPGFWERFTKYLNPFGFFGTIGDDKLRLACQMEVEGDCEIETKPSLNWHGEKFWS